MKTLTGRFALAFLCVIIFFIAQGGFAVFNLYTLSTVHENAQLTQMHFKELSAELDALRLVVYKLLGTMNPDEMDKYYHEYKQRMQELTLNLVGAGLDPGLVEKNRLTYVILINEHYNFSVKTARRMIENESKNHHEKIVKELKSLSLLADERAMSEVKKVRQSGMLATMVLGLAALATAVIWAIVLLRTVTDRSEAQAAVDRERRRLQLLLENLPGLVFLLRSDMTVPFANKKFIELMGEPKSNSYVKLFDKHEPPFDRSLINRLLEDDSEVEKEWIGPDGRTYQIHIYPFTEADGIRVALNIGYDITRRKNAEQALRESEAFHRGLFENSAMPTFLQDFEAALAAVRRLREQGIKDLRSYLEENQDEMQRLSDLVTMIRVNQAALDLYQAESPDEILGSLSRVLSPGMSSHFVDQLELFEKGGVLYEGESVNYTAKGETIDVIIRKNVISSPNNDYSQVLVTLTDVTELHNAHQEKALLESHLQQARKMEAIGRLAGGISHDFNNILAAMLGYTELLLLEAPKDSTTTDNLNQIMKAGRRAKALVMQILNFSRQGETEFITINLAPIISEASKLIRSIIPTTIELKINIDNESSSINGDSTQIHQILMNLCSNAEFALRRRGGVLEIKLSNIELDRQTVQRTGLPPGFYCKLVVRDTGQGMDKKTIERAFDPFFTTKDQGEGTGMGLAVVYGIVKKHLGALTVDSALHEGSTFTIFLPLVPDLTRYSEEPAGIEALGGNEQILFVDDEPVIADLAKKLLERLGYRVISMTSSVDAVGFFETNFRNIDLVMTDYTMPGLTGLEMAGKMLEIKPDAPIILCTGFSHELSEETALQAGIKRFLFKPLEVGQTARTIRDVLDRS